jgi:hypothetical protein
MKEQLAISEKQAIEQQHLDEQNKKEFAHQQEMEYMQTEVGSLHRQVQ